MSSIVIIRNNPSDVPFRFAFQKLLKIDAGSLSIQSGFFDEKVVDGDLFSHITQINGFLEISGALLYHKSNCFNRIIELLSHRGNRIFNLDQFNEFYKTVGEIDDFKFVEFYNFCNKMNKYINEKNHTLNIIINFNPYNHSKKYTRYDSKGVPIASIIGSTNLTLPAVKPHYSGPENWTTDMICCR